MKYLLIIFILLASFPAYAKDYGSYSGAIYVRNYDGDTITFNLPGIHPIIGEKINIRVNGIDTPEIRGRCKNEKKLAKEAKLLVQSIMKNAKTIDLQNLDRGKYFRIVADVIVDGQNLKDILLQRGLGVNYGGGKKNKVWCN